jgi:light-harvesting complex I chlorophyll a/b binding protein 1
MAAITSQAVIARVAAPSKSSFSGVVAKPSPARALGKSNGASFLCSAKKSWNPGSETPAYLDGLPGSFGFDPFGFGEVPSNLSRFQTAELINGRWAMLGVAGMLAVEVLGQGNWADAPLAYLNGGTGTYLGVPVPFNLGTLALIEFAALAFAEIARIQETDPIKKTYPGGAFDPLGFSKGNVEELKLKEIKNARLAMVAFIGFVAQHDVTGKGPVANLVAHIADPWHVNVATNGAFPFLP